MSKIEIMFKALTPIILAALLLTACTSQPIIQDTLPAENPQCEIQVDALQPTVENTEIAIQVDESALAFKPETREASESERAFVLQTSAKIEGAIAEIRKEFKDLPKDTPCMALLEEACGAPLSAAFAVVAEADWKGFIPFPQCKYVLAGGISAKQNEDSTTDYDINVKIIRRSNNLDVEYIANVVNVPTGDDFIFPLSAMQAETYSNGNKVRVLKYVVFFTAGEAVK